MLPERPNRLFPEAILQAETDGVLGNRQVSSQPLIRADEQLHTDHFGLSSSSLKLLCKNQNAERLTEEPDCSCSVMGEKKDFKSTSITYTRFVSVP